MDQYTQKKDQRTREQGANAQRGWKLMSCSKLINDIAIILGDVCFISSETMSYSMFASMLT